MPGTRFHVTFTTSNVHDISKDLSVPPGLLPDFGGVDAADWVATFKAS